MEIASFTSYYEKIRNNCNQVIIGKDEKIFLVLICFICSGHVLLEDVPGTGKTMLLRAFAKTIDGGFKRIQFTPDLLPSDLTGINYYNQQQGEFLFRPGPLFSNIILADEINRATPRTQSSLLEAMEERQISVDGNTRALEEPFMVMATQNPLESYGTFPLPEAQIDRFFMRLSLGYMNRDEEMAVLSRPSAIDLIEDLKCRVTPEETQYVCTHYQEVYVSMDVKNYLMDLIEKTRQERHFLTGVSTRGAIALYKASQGAAALQGRDYVLPEDVKFLAPYVLSHRLSGGNGRISHAQEILEEIIETTEVPLETMP